MVKRAAYFIVVIFLLALVTGCTLVPSTQRSREPQQEGGPTPTPIPTPIVPTKPVYEVKQGEVINIIQFSGRVSPVEERELFFETGGRVRAVYVERDDLVTAGQLLADLEIDDLERDLASTLLDLERADQQLAEAEQAHGDALARAELRLSMAEANLANADRDNAFALARAKLDLAIKEIQLLKERNQDLSPKETIAQVDLEKARIGLRQAQAAYDAIAYGDSAGASSQAMNLERATLDFTKAQATYDLTVRDMTDREFDINLIEQSIALARLKIEELETGGPGEQLVQAVALAQLEVNILNRGLDPLYANNVERAKLNVEKLDAAIADAQIIAPFDGEVVTISLVEGRDVTPYNPVIIVANPSLLEISANPTDAQLRELTEEMPLTITLSNRPGEIFNGLIRRLPYPYGGGGRSQGVEDEDTSTRITMDVTPEEAGLTQGNLVRIEVELERKDKVLWLAPQAIRTFDGRKFVVVQEGDAQRRVDIKVGIESEDRVEIEEGLTVGQVIVGP